MGISFLGKLSGPPEITVFFFRRKFFNRQKPVPGKAKIQDYSFLSHSIFIKMPIGNKFFMRFKPVREKIKRLTPIQFQLSRRQKHTHT